MYILCKSACLVVFTCICMCVLLGFGDLGSGFEESPLVGLLLYCIVFCYIGMLRIRYW